eukprot:scaffold3575_cov17-Tisochrysis_lutea.AAC.1
MQGKSCWNGDFAKLLQSLAACSSDWELDHKQRDKQGFVGKCWSPGRCSVQAGKNRNTEDSASLARFKQCEPCVLCVAWLIQLVANLPSCAGAPPLLVVGTTLGELQLLQMPQSLNHLRADDALIPPISLLHGLLRVQSPITAMLTMPIMTAGGIS